MNTYIACQFSITVFFLTICNLLPQSVSGSQEIMELVTVDQIVKEVLNVNPAVHQSDALEQAADRGVTSTRRNLLPKLAASYQYTGFDSAPIMKTAVADQQIAHTNQFKWEIALVQPIFTGFARILGLEKALLDVEYTREQSRTTMLDLTLESKVACYNLLLSQKVLSVAREEAMALESHVTNARMFYEQQLIPQNDLLKSQVALAAAVQEVERADAAVTNAISEINTLLNRDLETEFTLQDNCTILKTALQLDSLYEQALQFRPIFNLLANSDKQLEIAEKLRKSPRYPQVDLVAAYSQDGDSLWATDNDYSNDNNATVMLTMSWTFQWGKTFSDAARVRKEKQALLYQICDMKNRVKNQVKTAYQNLNVALKNIVTAETALHQARENYRITELQYRQQLVNSSEVLDARVYLTSAERNYYSAVYGYQLALAALSRAVGTDL